MAWGASALLCLRGVGAELPAVAPFQAENQGEAVVRMVSTISAHEQSVVSVAFSPQGDLVATCSVNGTAKIWHLGDPKAHRTLAGLPPARDDGTWEREIVFSPDGKMVVIGCSGNSVQLWEVSSGKRLFSRDVGARSLAFSPDGETLLTGDWEDPDIRLWSVKALKQGKTLAGTAAKFNAGCWAQTSIAFAPSGKSFASAVGGADQKVRIPTRFTIWDAGTLKPTVQFDTTLGRVHSMDWSPDGRQVAFSSGSYVKLYALPTPMAGKVDEPEIGKLLAALDDERFGVREAAERELIGMKAAAENELRRAAGESESPEVRFRANRILKARAKRGTNLDPLPEKLAGTIMAVQYSPDGRYLVACSRLWRGKGGSLVVWDATIEPMKRIFRQSSEIGLTSLAFAPDSRKMIVAGQDGKVTVWDLPEPEG
jgi:WD40 repeat protein